MKWSCWLLPFKFLFVEVMPVDLFDKAREMISRLARANEHVKVNYVTRSCKRTFAVRFVILVGIWSRF